MGRKPSRPVAAGSQRVEPRREPIRCCTTAPPFKASGNGGAFNVVGQMAATEVSKYGGTCTVSSCAGDYYTLTGLSSTAWKAYTVPFSYLVGGTLTPFDPTSTCSFEFQFYSATSLTGARFDPWIDDLSFYEREGVPAGAGLCPDGRPACLCGPGAIGGMMPRQPES